MHFYFAVHEVWVKQPVHEFWQKQSIAKTGHQMEKHVMFAIHVFLLIMALHLNIHELDAASNNSVDDIRALVDQVRFAPQAGKYKVYIVDEVHMLSASAFNAFLKTLEEPPPYAIFILATTEKHKILPTILIPLPDI